MKRRTQIVRIEMEVPVSVDLSTILEIMQDAALRVYEFEDDSAPELTSSNETQIMDSVSVEVVGPGYLVK